MLEKYLTKNLVVFNATASTPEEVIRLAGNLLLDEGKIKQEYVDAMIESYHKLGSYIVIAPHIAMPHARPSKYVNEKSISFIKLKTPVKFNSKKNDPVKIVFALAGKDDESHLGMIKELAELLTNPKKVEKLKHVNNYQNFLKIIS